MAKAPTERQNDIKRLLDAGRDAGEIAEILGTSAQAVHTQVSRMRKLGMLPKATRGGRRPRRAPLIPAENLNVTGDIREEEQKQTGALNGMSVEEHVNIELTEVVERLAKNSQQRVELDEEHGQLESRRGRLEAAQEALATTPDA